MKLSKRQCSVLQPSSKVPSSFDSLIKKTYSPAHQMPDTARQREVNLRPSQPRHLPKEKPIMTCSQLTYIPNTQRNVKQFAGDMYRGKCIRHQTLERRRRHKPTPDIPATSILKLKYTHTSTPTTLQLLPISSQATYSRTTNTTLA